MGCTALRLQHHRRELDLGAAPEVLDNDAIDTARQHPWQHRRQVRASVRKTNFSMAVERSTPIRPKRDMKGWVTLPVLSSTQNNSGPSRPLCGDSEEQFPTAG